MVSAGYVRGSNGALAPQGTITRAEFAQVKSYITQAGAYEAVDEGTVVVRASGASPSPAGC